MLCIFVFAVNIWLPLNRFAHQNDFDGNISLYAIGLYSEPVDAYGMRHQKIGGVALPKSSMYIVPDNSIDAGSLVTLDLQVGLKYIIYEKEFRYRTTYFIIHEKE